MEENCWDGECQSWDLNQALLLLEPVCLYSYGLLIDMFVNC